MRTAIGSVAVFVLIACAILVGYGYHRSRSTPSLITLAMNDDGTPVSTSADLLVRNYAVNEIAADRKYRDHQFPIRGVVVGVARDADGRALAVLDGASDEHDARRGDDRPIVLVHFASEDEAVRLVPGRVAQLRCIGDGVSLAGRPRVRGCVHVE